MFCRGFRDSIIQLILCLALIVFHLHFSYYWIPILKYDDLNLAELFNFAGSLKDSKYKRSSNIPEVSKIDLTSKKSAVSDISQTYIQKDAYNLATKSEHGQTKKILLYDRIWSNVAIEQGPGVFRNCRVSNCYLTKQRKKYQWRDWDAILWDNVFTREKSKPLERNPHTRYVLMNREGPARYGGLKSWPVVFNWTMTYRVDSEIPFRYGYVYKFPIERPLVLPKNKTGLAAWFCSDNHSKSGREQLRKTLEKHMHIDIYGTVGPLKCGQGCRSYNRDQCDTDCRDMVGNKYKFYLAFEPSLCKDWATEKLYIMLQQPIVPVIWSGLDLSQLAPPHSAINALDFDTAKDLVDYLRYLDGNDAAYFEYFEWKKTYGILAGPSTVTFSFCQLCARLHEDTSSHWYSDLHDWWVHNQCIDPNSPRIRKFLNITDKVHLPYPKSGEDFRSPW